MSGPLAVDEAAKAAWINHWHVTGLTALELELARDQRRGRFCVGDTPTMADCCLVPQLFSASRFGLGLAPFPALRAIDTACQELPALPARAPGATA